MASSADSTWSLLEDDPRFLDLDLDVEADDGSRGGDDFLALLGFRFDDEPAELEAVLSSPREVLLLIHC